MTKVRAILFDFGGVILASPITAFRQYEARMGLPVGFVQQINSRDPDTNAWACMERGELDEATFFSRFEAEARALGHELDGRAVLALITGGLHPEMVAAVRALKSRYVVACLTNNMALGHGTAMAATPERAAPVAEVMALFDHVVESSKIGARKPEPRFFEKACAVVGAPPAECVFLDDLGMNLKPARAMGMRTIKVGDPAVALAELEAILGHPITAR